MIIKSKKGGNYFWTEKDSIKYYNADDHVISEHKWAEVKSIDRKTGLFGKVKAIILYFTGGEEYEIPAEGNGVEAHLMEMVNVNGNNKASEITSQKPEINKEE